MTSLPPRQTGQGLAEHLESVCDVLRRSWEERYALMDALCSAIGPPLERDVVGQFRVSFLFEVTMGGAGGESGGGAGAGDVAQAGQAGASGGVADTPGPPGGAGSATRRPPKPTTRPCVISVSLPADYPAKGPIVARNWFGLMPEPRRYSSEAGEVPHSPRWPAHETALRLHGFVEGLLRSL